MASSSSVQIRFQGGPGRIGAACDAYADQLLAGLGALAQAAAARGETAMRTDARWTDRTTDARNGLTGEAVERGDAYVIAFYGLMDYTIYLELAHAGRFAIIRPTIDALGPEIVADVAALLGGSAH